MTVLALLGAWVTLPPHITFTPSAGAEGRDGFAELFEVKNEGWLQANNVTVGISFCYIDSEVHALGASVPNAAVGEPCTLAGWEMGGWDAKALTHGQSMTVALSDALDNQPKGPEVLFSTQSVGRLAAADFYVTARYHVWPLPGRFIEVKRFTGTRKAGSEVEWRTLPSDPRIEKYSAKDKF